jgi:hypothetical protein
MSKEAPSKQVIRRTEDSVPNWRPVPGVKVQKLTVGNAVVQFAKLDPRTNHCILSIEAADVRISFDGDDPVSGVSQMLLQYGTYGYWGRDMISAMKLIRNAGTNATAWLQQCITAVGL